VGDLPSFGFFRLPRGLPYRFFLNQKHTNPLNCGTSSSGISGYHADFHEGYGTVGKRQGRGMALPVASPVFVLYVKSFTFCEINRIRKIISCR
jgi:hypothetical protein